MQRRTANMFKKNRKFEIDDVRERGFWDKCMSAYEEAINEASRPWAPWYAIPVDNKPFMRVAVAEIIVKILTKLGLEYPHVGFEVKTKFSEMWRMLENED
nr:hypothetical protein [Desulfosarcina widdelii]